MKQITKRVVAFFAAMGLMVSGLSLNEPASADAKAKTIVTQAYSTGNDAKGTEGKFLDPVVTQL